MMGRRCCIVTSALLNVVRIPDWAALGMAHPPDPDKLTVHDLVMFRHWDPRVLGDIMPVLDAEQVARMLGPAEEIAYIADDYGGLKRVIREPDLPSAPRGALTIRADQIEALDARRHAAYYRRMSAHLRDMAPKETSGMGDDEVHDRVLRYEASGLKLGLTHERTLSIWGFLDDRQRGPVRASAGGSRLPEIGARHPGRECGDPPPSDDTPLQHHRRGELMPFLGAPLLVGAGAGGGTVAAEGLPLEASPYRAAPWRLGRRHRAGCPPGRRYPGRPRRLQPSRRNSWRNG